MSLLKDIFCTKDINKCSDDGSRLNRTFGSLGLVILGIGAIIGGGIFVITGVASSVVGPAIIFSFIGAAIACGLVALCFAELGSIITLTGGVYTYTQFALGELCAWIVGWSVLLQIIITASTVAIGWSSYFNGFLNSIGLYLPMSLINSPLISSSLINLPALIIVAILTLIVLMGATSSKRVNNVIVFAKIIVILIFIIVGVHYINPSNYVPFMPNGVGGVLQGTAMVFFAYLGFEAVATTSEETKNPKKAIPIGIMGSLLICGVLYILVVVVMTGMVKYSEFSGVAAPVHYALSIVGANWIISVVTIGIITGLTTVILVNLYVIPRILYSMSRDGLLPHNFKKINQKYKIPVLSVILSGIVIGLISAFIPLGNIFELANMGALTGFIASALGIIYLRKNYPDIPRKFKCPFVPILPLVTIILCLILMTQLKPITLISFGLWTLTGLGIYFGYKKYKLISN
jgi:basic amino acid/polyamine antiporter, APA family